MTTPDAEGQAVARVGVMEVIANSQTYFVGARIGTSSGDRIESEGLLAGGQGNDSLFGGAQDDILYGGDGADFLFGGAGGDRLVGGADYDYAGYSSAVVARMTHLAGNTGEAAGDAYDGIEGLSGSAYNDTLGGDRYGNNLFGRAGHDALLGEEGHDALSGEDGSDSLVGGADGDILDGGAGFDYAEYHTAASGVVVDLLNAGRNTGDAAGDSYVSIEGLTGSRHKDELVGNHLGNELYGLGGDDTLEGRGGADWLYGGAGHDFASYYQAASGVRANLSNAAQNSGEAAGDVYDSIEALSGSQFDDTLTGNGDGNNLYGHEGADRLNGLAGRDYLVGGGGNDVLDGGAGGDWLIGGAGSDAVAYTMAVLANLSDVSQNTGEAVGDIYESVENIFGSAYNDVLTGNGGYNELFGHNGHDALYGLSDGDFLSGGEGHDLLVGGAGSDRLTGGTGTDIFRFDMALGSSNVDTVNDFSVGEGDLLQLSRSVFTAFASQGSVGSWQFTIGPSATTADQRLIYNNVTGAVSYDADGVGGAAQIQFATIGKYLALSASSFALIWV